MSNGTKEDLRSLNARGEFGPCNGTFKTRAAAERMCVRNQEIINNRVAAQAFLWEVRETGNGRFQIWCKPAV